MPRQAASSRSGRALRPEDERCREPHDRVDGSSGAKGSWSSVNDHSAQVKPASASTYRSDANAGTTRAPARNARSDGESGKREDDEPEVVVEGCGELRTGARARHAPSFGSRPPRSPSPGNSPVRSCYREPDPPRQRDSQPRPLPRERAVATHAAGAATMPQEQLRAMQAARSWPSRFVSIVAPRNGPSPRRAATTADSIKPESERVVQRARRSSRVESRPVARACDRRRAAPRARAAANGQSRSGGTRVARRPTIAWRRTRSGRTRTGRAA